MNNSFSKVFKHILKFLQGIINIVYSLMSTCFTVFKLNRNLAIMTKKWVFQSLRQLIEWCPNNCISDIQYLPKFDLGQAYLSSRPLICQSGDAKIYIWFSFFIVRWHFYSLTRAGTRTTMGKIAFAILLMLFSNSLLPFSISHSQRPSCRGSWRSCGL